MARRGVQAVTDDELTIALAKYLDEAIERKRYGITSNDNDTATLAAIVHGLALRAEALAEREGATIN